MTDPAPSPQPEPPAESATDLLKRLGPAAWAAVYTLTVPIAGCYLLYRYNAQIGEFIRSMGPWAPVVFAGAMAVPLGAALLPTWVTAVLAGFLFRAQAPAVGAGAATGAIVIGSAIGYALGTLVAGDRARRVVREHPRWEAVEEELLESGFWRALGVIALIRLPSTPYALTNLVMAALRAPVGAFVLGTLIGVLPRTVLWTFVGRGLGGFSQDDLSRASQPKWVLAVTIGAAILGVIVIGAIARRALARFAGGPRS